jgi:hypothetical protein
VIIHVFNIPCAFSCNKRKKLTARMHGVESFKIGNITVYYGGILSAHYNPTGIKPGGKPCAEVF